MSRSFNDLLWLASHAFARRNVSLNSQTPHQSQFPLQRRSFFGRLWQRNAPRKQPSATKSRWKASSDKNERQKNVTVTKCRIFCMRCGESFLHRTQGLVVTHLGP